MATLSFLRDSSPASLHAPRKAIEALRVVVALIVLSHPVYMLSHPATVGDLASVLASRHVPLANVVAWIGTFAFLPPALLLLVDRFVYPAAAGLLACLGLSALLAYAPYWFVFGGGAVEGKPGVEFHVLLLACVAAVWRVRAGDKGGVASDRADERALSLVRWAVAIVLGAHGLLAFVAWNPEGMREFGHEMEEVGFPAGVVLVWMMVTIQALASFALAANRFVVLAAFAHAFILANGVWITHRHRWFVVGPNTWGMEYSLVLLAALGGIAYAAWPRGAALRVEAQVT